LVAIALGVALELNQTLFKALNPYVQILRAISPIAWMPLLLYSVRSSGWTAILVLFMASVRPTMANTAFGVAGIRKDYSAYPTSSRCARPIPVEIPANAIIASGHRA